MVKSLPLRGCIQDVSILMPEKSAKTLEDSNKASGETAQNAYEYEAYISPSYN